MKKLHEIVTLDNLTHRFAIDKDGKDCAYDSPDAEKLCLVAHAFREIEKSKVVDYMERLLKLFKEQIDPVGQLIIFIRNNPQGIIDFLTVNDL